MKEHAYAFEAVMVSMSKTKDGVKVVFVIHPDDKDGRELFSHPIGSQYQIAAVLLDNENKPTPRQDKVESSRAVTSAAMLCRNNDFIQWLHGAGMILDPTEEDAVNYIHHACDIMSRAELATNAVALEKFEAIRDGFINAWSGRNGKGI